MAHSLDSLTQAAAYVESVESDKRKLDWVQQQLAQKIPNLINLLLREEAHKIQKMSPVDRTIHAVKKEIQKEKLEEFNVCIKHAMSLTEKKRYYLGDFKHTGQQAIDWWKKKASKRYDKLTREDRVRTKLEVWQPGVDMEIIR